MPSKQPMSWLLQDNSQVCHTVQNLTHLAELTNQSACYSKLLQAHHGPLSVRWIPACAQILIEHRQEWTYLVPNSEEDSAALVQQFFACLASLMSTQLRSLVINSLADFVSFLSFYQVTLIELGSWDYLTI